MECRVLSQQIIPFTRISGYRFQETCEYELVTTCSLDGSQNVPHVQVNFKSENLAVDHIATQWTERVVTFFQNSSGIRIFQNGSNPNVSGGVIRISSNGISFGIVAAEGNVTVLKSLGTEPFLSISISSASGSLSQLCGLCGDRQGNLRLRNGQVANPDMPQEVAMFVTDFRVQLSNRIFQNTVQECGK